MVAIRHLRTTIVRVILFAWPWLWPAAIWLLNSNVLLEVLLGVLFWDSGLVCVQTTLKTCMHMAGRCGWGCSAILIVVVRTVLLVVLLRFITPTGWDNAHA